jgi:altronate dehydratase
MRASKAAREFVQWASERQREECALAELWVSTKCLDKTGAQEPSFAKPGQSPSAPIVLHSNTKYACA